MKSSASSFIKMSVVSGLVLQLGACGMEQVDDEADETAEITSALSSRTAATDVDTKTTVTKTPLPPKTDPQPDATAALKVVVPTVTFTQATVASVVTSDLDRSYPWVVDISGTGGLNCRGVLIHPSWVLTAAHCIGTIAGTVSYSRTDAATGVQSGGSRSFDVNGPKRGMFPHPEFVADSGFGQPKNDLALIRLQTPFALDRNIQTVGLPRAAANPGRVGSVATHNHGAALPPGYTAVLRAAQLASCASPTGFFCADPPATSLCKGDSGSGFVEVLDGRAQVVGITSNISGGDDCIGAGGQAQFADVFNYRSWILSTMGMSFEQVAGNVRLRWAGAASAGTLSLTCLSTGGAPIEVAMNVPGGEIGMNCDDARVFCQPGSGYALTGFSLSSFNTGGGFLGTQAMPYLSAFTAAYANPGTGFQTYTCTESGGLISGVYANTATTATLAQ